MARIARPTPQRQRHFIKEWRESRGWSQAELCGRLDALEPPYTISESQLSRIERGDQAYSQDLLEALAAVFRIDVTQLVGGGPAMKKVPDDVIDLWTRLKPRDEAVARLMLKSMSEAEETADIGHDPNIDEVPRQHPATIAPKRADLQKRGATLLPAGKARKHPKAPSRVRRNDRD